MNPYQSPRDTPHEEIVRAELAPVRQPPSQPMTTAGKFILLGLVLVTLAVFAIVGLADALR